MENPNDKIHIVVWDATAAEGADPMGKCEYGLPMEQGYDQRMLTEWLTLSSADGKQSRGRIRVGIQYIYDQVKMLESTIRQREEEKQTHLAELTTTQRVLDTTSSTAVSHPC